MHTHSITSAHTLNPQNYETIFSIEALICGAAGGMHHSVAHLNLCYITAHNLLKGVLQETSGLRIVQQNGLGGS